MILWRSQQTTQNYKGSLTLQEELNSAEKRHGLESGPCPAGPKMTVAQPVPWLQLVRDPEVEHAAERRPDSCPKEAGRL